MRTRAFRELGCPTCHDVVGGPADPEGERPDVIVTLGGKVTRVETYGELVASIINPSHEICRRYPRAQVAIWGSEFFEDAPRTTPNLEGVRGRLIEVLVEYVETLQTERQL